jgi:hypothetical protein
VCRSTPAAFSPVFFTIDRISCGTAKKKKLKNYARQIIIIIIFRVITTKIKKLGSRCNMQIKPFETRRWLKNSRKKQTNVTEKKEKKVR